MGISVGTIVWVGIDVGMWVVGTIVWVGIDVGMWVGSVVDGNVVGEGVGGTCGLGVGASVSTTRAKSSMAISDEAVERAQFATVRICMFFGDRSGWA